MNDPGNQPRIGLIVLIIGIVAVAAAFLPAFGRGLAAITGALTAVVGALFIVQLVRYFGQDGVNAGAGDVLSNAVGIAPWIALGLNRWLPGLDDGSLPVLPTLAALAVGYAFGEGIGRLACISYGCCYGKPLRTCGPRVKKIFRLFAKQLC